MSYDRRPLTLTSHVRALAPRTKTQRRIATDSARRGAGILFTVAVVMAHAIRKKGATGLGLHVRPSGHWRRCAVGGLSPAAASRGSCFSFGQKFTDRVFRGGLRTTVLVSGQMRRWPWNPARETGVCIAKRFTGTEGVEYGASRIELDARDGATAWNAKGLLTHAK